MSNSEENDFINSPTSSLPLPKTKDINVRQTLSVKKKKDELKQDDQVEIDETLCKFFAKTGLPSDTVRDYSFLQFVHILNKDYSPPTPSTVDYELQVINKDLESKKLGIDLVEWKTPISVTIDVVEKPNDLFLAFSLHYFRDNEPRTNVVYLQKMKTSTIFPQLIFNEVKLVAKQFVEHRFANVIVANKKLLQSFQKSDAFEASSMCYFSLITNFAEAILNISELSTALSNLKKFYLEVKKDYHFQHRIESQFYVKRIVFDLPNVEFSNWIDIYNFLSHVLQYHQLLSNMKLQSKLEQIRLYIEQWEYERLMYLQAVLSHLDKSVKEISKADSYSSQVLPEIVKIHKCILTDLTDDNDISFRIKKEFDKHLASLYYNKVNSKTFNIATFLDPRYSFDLTIFPLNVWNIFRENVRNFVGKSDLMMEYNSTPKQRSHIDTELELYENSFKEPRKNTNPVVWWRENSKKFLVLSNAARICMTSPPCAIDGEQYFGKYGKFMINNSKMTMRQFNNTLAVAASLETYRGRGWTDKHIPLESFDRVGTTLKPIVAPVIKKKLSTLLKSTNEAKNSKKDEGRKKTVPIIPLAEDDEEAKEIGKRVKLILFEAMINDPKSSFWLENRQPKLEEDEMEQDDSKLSDLCQNVKDEPIDCNDSIVDISKFYMQAPGSKLKEDEEEKLGPETKPETLIESSFKKEESEPLPSTSSSIRKTPINVGRRASDIESKKIERPANRRVVIKLPYQRTEMERALKRASDDPLKFHPTTTTLSKANKISKLNFEEEKQAVSTHCLTLLSLIEQQQSISGDSGAEKDGSTKLPRL